MTVSTTATSRATMIVMTMTFRTGWTCFGIGFRHERDATRNALYFLHALHELTPGVALLNCSLGLAFLVVVSLAHCSFRRHNSSSTKKPNHDKKEIIEFMPYLS